MSKKSLKNKSAFTVIELIIVILITGIITALAIAQMPDMQQIRTNQAAEKIQSDIRFAQRLAMQLQRRTAILFSASSDDYSIFIENTYQGNNWSSSIKAKNPLTQEDFTVELNTGNFAQVDITAAVFNVSGNALVFDRNGDPYGMAFSSPYSATALTEPAWIALNTSQKYIMVKQNTGRVNVQNTFP